MREFLGLAIALLGFAACFSTTRPSAVNDDPIHGGRCHNGDQLAEACPRDGSCCPYGYMCATDGHGCEVNPAEWGPDMVNGNIGSKRDAGR